MKRVYLTSLVLTALTMAVLPKAATAASTYANWLKVKSVSFNAASNTYLVTFDGDTSTTEVDETGNSCGDYSSAAIKADTNGVDTTDLEVDRMVSMLEVARATGLRVRLWAHQCTNSNSSVTYPKAYIVITME